MTVSLYTFVGLYDRALITATHLLDRGLAHVDQTGVGKAEMLDWRLIDDMQPFRFQLMVLVNFAQQWPTRVAGLPVPESIGTDLDAGAWQEAIAKAREYLATLRPEQFENRDDVPLTFRISDQLEASLPAGQWLTVFATTNIYFHLSTAYGILRAHGVPIGKRDLFAGGL